MERSCEEKLHLGSMLEQLHGCWLIWEAASMITCSKEEAKLRDSGVFTDCYIKSIPIDIESHVESKHENVIAFSKIK